MDPYKILTPAQFEAAQKEAKCAYGAMRGPSPPNTICSQCRRLGLECVEQGTGFKCFHCRKRNVTCPWVVDLQRRHVLDNTNISFEYFNNLYLLYVTVDPLSGTRYSEKIPPSLIQYYREAYDRSKPTHEKHNDPPMPHPKDPYVFSKLGPMPPSDSPSSSYRHSQPNTDLQADGGSQLSAQHNTLSDSAPEFDNRSQPDSRPSTNSQLKSSHWQDPQGTTSHSPRAGSSKAKRPTLLQVPLPVKPRAPRKATSGRRRINRPPLPIPINSTTTRQYEGIPSLFDFPSPHALLPLLLAYARKSPTDPQLYPPVPGINTSSGASSRPLPSNPYNTLDAITQAPPLTITNLPTLDSQSVSQRGATDKEGVPDHPGEDAQRNPAPPSIPFSESPASSAVPYFT